MVRLGMVGMALLLPVLLGGAVMAAGLPGGASSLQETYQDWRVICAQPEAKNLICTFSQLQTNQQGQRVLAIEMTPSGAAAASGNLVLPFGLLLDAGAVLQVDEAAPAAAQRFSTCLPDGCVAPIAFTGEALSALRAGTKLNVHLQPADGGGTMVLPISLRGFSRAFERTLELLGAP